MTLTETNPTGTAKLTTLDARGLNCPMPIVKTAQAVKNIASGELLEVLTTDPGAVADFAAWSRATGNDIVEQTIQDGVYRFVLRRK
jgi:tRNA 2-thiouridine synthesizing protein A